MWEASTNDGPIYSVCHKVSRSGPSRIVALPSDRPHLPLGDRKQYLILSRSYFVWGQMDNRESSDKTSVVNANTSRLNSRTGLIKAMRTAAIVETVAARMFEMLGRS